MDIKTIKINVVIPTYNRKEELVKTIDSFKRILNNSSNIYVVNNNKFNINNLIIDNVKLLNSEINGPCQARNMAIDFMEPCDWVWFADDDLYIYDDFPIRKLLKFKHKFDVINFDTYPKKNKFYKSLLYFKKDSRLLNKESYNSFYISGGNFCIRYSCAIKLRWDDNYHGYSHGEDLDYGLSILKNNFKTIQTLNSYVLHYGEFRKKNYINIKREYVALSYVFLKHNIKKNVFIKCLLKTIICNPLKILDLFLTYYLIKELDTVKMMDFYNEI